jgi:predicted nucleotidyltransferase
MKYDPFEKLIKDIDIAFKQKKEVSMVLIFGSVARGEAEKQSDLDLCIISSKREKRNVSDFLLDMEKKYNKDINVIFTDSEFKDLSRQFIETIIKEGVVLKGKIPEISVQRLELEPYEIMKYELTSLSQTDKMKVKRLLYGSKSIKKYKGKVYHSEKNGLVKKFGGIRMGIASILIPERHAGEVERALREHGARLRKYTVWMSKA